MKSCLYIVFILYSLFTFSQSDSLQFPQDYFGIYKGDLKIYNAKDEQTIKMEFHLNKTNTIGKYQYMLVYIMNGNRQERNYTLIEKDIEKGQFVVDENNGILLDAKLVGHTLYFMFEVQGNILTTTERFYNNAMDFEITFTEKSNQVESGTSGEEATKVISYPISVVQKAHLIKQ